MDLNAPPLVPLAVLALASSGQLAPGEAPKEERARPAQRAQPAVVMAGQTEQRRPVSMRLRAGRAAWEIAYVARCDDDTVLRGRYYSGEGTPEIEPGRGGRFRLTGSEPAEFRREGTGSARFAIAGRLGRAGGEGTWRVRFVTPPGERGRATCTAGPLSWRVAPR